MPTTAARRAPSVKLHAVPGLTLSFLGIMKGHIQAGTCADILAMSGDEELLRRELEHARWRVEFLTSLLEKHRFVRTADQEWTDKEADYVKRLANAISELDRIGQDDPAQPGGTGAP